MVDQNCGIIAGIIREPSRLHLCLAILERPKFSRLPSIPKMLLTRPLKRISARRSFVTNRVPFIPELKLAVDSLGNSAKQAQLSSDP